MISGAGDIELGTVGEWIAALATILVVVFAWWQIKTTRGNARDEIATVRQAAAEQVAASHAEAAADREVSRESITVATQALEHDRQRWELELEDRRRKQAELIACWIAELTNFQNGPKLKCVVLNSSTTVVYDVRAFLVYQGALFRGDLNGPSVMARTTEIVYMPSPASTESSRTPDKVGVTFRDA